MDTSIAPLIERLSRILQNDTHAHGLKPAQWEALRYLARANRFSRSPSALTAYLGLTKGTVSQTLQALDRKGLIRKTVADGDRRSVKLDLMKSGEKLLADDPMADLGSSIADMPKAVREELGTSLERLLKGMLDARGGRPFGACHTCRHLCQDHGEGAPHYCGLLKQSLSTDDIGRICMEQETARSS